MTGATPQEVLLRRPARGRWPPGRCRSLGGGRWSRPGCPRTSGRSGGSGWWRSTAKTGDRVFDTASRVGLVDAVAASSAVPGIWRPVTIGGRRYMDGGMRAMDNADLAADAKRVVMVSPFGMNIRGPVPMPLPEVVARLREGGATSSSSSRMRRRRPRGRQPTGPGNPARRRSGAGPGPYRVAGKPAR